MGTLDWLPRDSELKDHNFYGDEYFSEEAPGVRYQKRPVVNPKRASLLRGSIRRGFGSTTRGNITPTRPRWLRA